MGSLNLMLTGALLTLGCSNGEKFATYPQAESWQVTWNAPAEIPDADTAGIRLGPLAVPESVGQLGDLGLYLEITHPNAADIRVWLCYDADNDGIEDIRVEAEFYRGKKTGWDQREPFACPQELSGHYYFGGGSAGDSPFAAFRGWNAGGSFYLTVVDSLPQETGIIQGWSVQGVRPGSASDTR
jgi:subtilisin-like proprotein convertase family protein